MSLEVRGQVLPFASSAAALSRLTRDTESPHRAASAVIVTPSPAYARHSAALRAADGVGHDLAGSWLAPPAACDGRHGDRAWMSGASTSTTTAGPPSDCMRSTKASLPR